MAKATGATTATGATGAAGAASGGLATIFLVTGLVELAAFVELAGAALAGAALAGFVELAAFVLLAKAFLAGFVELDVVDKIVPLAIASIGDFGLAD